MDKTESAMKVAVISLAIIVGFVVIMLLTFAKANNTQVEPTEVETESTTEAETESVKEELEVKISVKEPPTEIIISADGVVLSESEVEAKRSEEAEELLEEVSIAIEEKREQEPVNTETLSIDEMEEIGSNIDAYVEAESVKMMRESAITLHHFKR